MCPIPTLWALAIFSLASANSISTSAYNFAAWPMASLTRVRNNPILTVINNSLPTVKARRVNMAATIVCASMLMAGPRTPLARTSRSSGRKWLLDRSCKSKTKSITKNPSATHNAQRFLLLSVNHIYDSTV